VVPRAIARARHTLLFTDQSSGSRYPRSAPPFEGSQPAGRNAEQVEELPLSRIGISEASRDLAVFLDDHNPQAAASCPDALPFSGETGPACR